MSRAEPLTRRQSVFRQRWLACRHRDTLSVVCPRATLVIAHDQRASIAAPKTLTVCNLIFIHCWFCWISFSQLSALSIISILTSRACGALCLTLCNTESATPACPAFWFEYLPFTGRARQDNAVVRGPTVATGDLAFFTRLHVLACALLPELWVALPTCAFPSIHHCWCQWIGFATHFTLKCLVFIILESAGDALPRHFVVLGFLRSIVAHASRAEYRESL